MAPRGIFLQQSIDGAQKKRKGQKGDQPHGMCRIAAPEIRRTQDGRQNMPEIRL